MKTNYLCRVEELKRLTDTIWLLELEANNAFHLSGAFFNRLGFFKVSSLLG
jgi:hypothetical protein